MNNETEAKTPEQSNPPSAVIIHRLVRLPNGSWVSPKSITAIRVAPTEYGGSGHLHRARVLVHHNNGYVEVVLANDESDAVMIADSLAAQVIGETNAELCRRDEPPVTLKSKQG